MVGGRRPSGNKRTAGCLTVFRDRDSDFWLAPHTARLIGLLAALALGCGPLRATSVINDAEGALARAHAAEGEKYALYETTLADLYLAKAREEQGHAHYADAAALAADALKYAEAATRKAAERPPPAAGPPTPTANIQRPPEEKKPAPIPAP